MIIFNIILNSIIFVLIMLVVDNMAENQKLIKIIAKLKFAYLNKNENLHQFEQIAIEQADEIIDKNGGMEKLIRD